jgi:hypothetical protein
MTDETSQWFWGGIAAPLLAIGYGVACFITRRATLYGSEDIGSGIDLYGVKAVAVGIASISLGLFFHFHLV